MSIHTLHFTSNATASLIRRELERSFPETQFDIAIDVPAPPYNLSQHLTAIIVRWTNGPARDVVEEAVHAFQGLDWNPKTGVLEAVEHLEVTDEGTLQRIEYGVDYVFCERPSDV
ncbi:MAG: LPD29 domain-containing protein [Rhodothermales bacterium]|nr:LPD29 domain-containing protein [Rhodothermales bacterium]